MCGNILINSRSGNGILNPLKVVIENYPEDKTEEFDVENNPEKPERGTRKVPFSREIYIDQEDFMINPPSKYISDLNLAEKCV